MILTATRAIRPKPLIPTLIAICKTPVFLIKIRYSPFGITRAILYNFPFRFGRGNFTKRPKFEEKFTKKQLRMGIMRMNSYLQFHKTEPERLFLRRDLAGLA
jgi:hypothetical protein